MTTKGGMIFIPRDLASFHEAKIEPLAFAVIRGEDIPRGRLEALQKACKGELEIFRRKKGSILITLPSNGDPPIPPRKFKRLLREICEVTTTLVTTTPKEQERITQDELRSSQKILC